MERPTAKELRQAVQAGDLDLVSRLLDAGADPLVGSLLPLAVWHGPLLFGLLCCAGCDVEDDLGEIIFQGLLSGQHDMLRCLLLPGFLQDRSWALRRTLSYAVRLSPVPAHLIEWLLREGADPAPLAFVYYSTDPGLYWLHVRVDIWHDRTQRHRSAAATIRALQAAVGPLLPYLRAAM